VTTTVPPGSLHAWVLAARPKTLLAAVVPVLVGTACAHVAGSFRTFPALAALAGALLLQITANFSNDVFDYEKGADTTERLGPVRAVQGGLIGAWSMKRAITITIFFALMVGTYLTAVAGPAIVVIGLLAILAAVAYTGGPYPLGYHGLGDLFVMLFFGFVAVSGTTFVQTGEVTELSLFAAVPVGALATAILVVNNLRDRETDARAGKRTLAVRFGERGALFEYAALLSLAYAVPVMLFVSGRSGPGALAPLLTLPFAAMLMRRVASERGRALNPRLAQTAALLFAHGVLFALGLTLATSGV